MRHHLIAAVCAVAVLGLAACERKAPEAITITNPYVRATPQTVTAGYLELTNNTGTDDALVSVTTDWAGKSELHNVVADKDVMTMIPVDTIVIPAGQTTALKSGSYHIMLFDLKGPLTVGETRDATLNFQHARPVKVTFKVKPITYKGIDHRH